MSFSCRTGAVTTGILTVPDIHGSRTMYRPKGENFFSKIERDLGYPRDSNCATTKRKVCLGPETDIQVTWKLFCFQSMLKTC